MYSLKAFSRYAIPTIELVRKEISSTFGLYSAFLACRAIVFRSRRQSRLTVATMFLCMDCEPSHFRGKARECQDIHTAKSASIHFHPG
jgi:hypothetical protein